MARSTFTLPTAPIAAWHAAYSADAAARKATREATQGLTFASLTLALALKEANPRTSLTDKRYVAALAARDDLTEGTARVYLVRGTTALRNRAAWRLTDATVEVMNGKGKWTTYTGGYAAFIRKITPPAKPATPDATPDATDKPATPDTTATPDATPDPNSPDLDPVERFGALVQTMRESLVGMPTDARADSVALLANLLSDFHLTVS